MQSLIRMPGEDALGPETASMRVKPLQPTSGGRMRVR